MMWESNAIAAVSTRNTPVPKLITWASLSAMLVISASVNPPSGPTTISNCSFSGNGLPGSGIPFWSATQTVQSLPAKATVCARNNFV